MCGKACQIPATMARDLPQPHTVYVSVCGWVSKRDGGCLLAVNMTTMRKHSSTEEAQNGKTHCIYQRWRSVYISQ